MTSPKDEPLRNVAALRRAIGATTTLKTILDTDWFDAVEQEIRSSPNSHPATADPSGFIYDFFHPLRSVGWFEEAQRLAQEGKVAQVSEAGKFALWFAGLDPIETTIPLIDARLQAFSAITFKPREVKVKLDELRATRSHASFKNHLYELNVLGDLARRNALVDIEEAATAVDGVIRIEGRDILVEATNTTQRVIPDFVGVFSTDPAVEIDQVVKKLHKKVADGRQLARANGKPTVLFLARTHLGADRQSAKIALHECFDDPDFAALSGVVLSDSWKLYKTSWNTGTRPDVPLSAGESQALAKWYD